MSEIAEEFGFATRSIHAGAQPDPTTGARNTPIFQTNSFVFESVDQAASLYNLQTFGHIYSRISNPTVAVLEERVANLEGGRAAVACASGHAAQLLAFFPLMAPGAEFVASRNLYGGSITQFTHTFRRFGWTAHFVDPRDPENFRRALTPNCQAFFAEQLTNPAGIVIDIEAIARIAHEAEIPFIVDNTMATPYLCRPFAWGADIVTHAMTKFLGGHGTAMGGIVVEAGNFDWGRSARFPALTRPEPAYHGLTFHETFGDFGYSVNARAVGLRDLGPSLAPMNAFLILTGIETLPLRMQRHCANALAVAEYLQGHRDVSSVSYAGLAAGPDRTLVQKYLPSGAGSVFTFGVRGGFERGVALVENCRLWSHLANVGDTRSLILHPASTTHRQLSDEQRQAAGAGPEVIRLSVGLEDSEDLIRDLDEAFAAARPAGRVARAGGVENNISQQRMN